MSILSGFLKTKKHRKMADGNYKLQSEWTSASTVEMADGNTAETNLGAIQGITDSLTATSSNIALSAKAGNNLQGQIDTVNSNLGSMDVIGSFRSNGQSVSIDYSKYRTIYVCMRINEFKTSVCDLNIPVKAITDHVFYAANTHAYINEEYKASFEIRFSDSSISLEAYFCYGWSFTDITVLGIK